MPLVYLVSICEFPQDKSPPAKRSSACANGGCLFSEQHDKCSWGICFFFLNSHFLLGKIAFSKPKTGAKKALIFYLQILSLRCFFLLQKLFRFSNDTKDHFVWIQRKIWFLFKLITYSFSPQVYRSLRL